METILEKAHRLKGSIFAGEQFVLVDATKIKPIELKLIAQPGGRETVQTFTNPTVISRYRYGVETTIPKWPLLGDSKEARTKEADNPLVFPRHKLADLSLVVAVTDRMIYRPKDPVRLFAIGLTAPGAAGQMSLSRGGQVILRNDLTLNDAGVSLTTLEDLDEGEYQVTVEIARQWSAECTFTVAAYSLSLLTAVLGDHTYENQKLSFVVTLRQLELPYNGSVELGLQCQVCGGRVVASKRAEVHNGKLDSFFEVGGHGGPFHVQITTAGGETAVVSFPGTRADVREAIPLSTLGHTITGGILPATDAQQARGLYLTEKGVSVAPFTVDNVLTRKGKILTLAQGGPVQLTAINPLTGEVVVQDFAQVSKGQMLTIDVAAPYTLYALGGWIEGKPYETWGVFVRPDDAKLSLDAPERALPGAEITLRMQTSKPGQCVLLVYDARLEHEDPLPKLAERLFRHLRDVTTPLHAGAMEPLSKTLLPGSAPSFMAGTARPMPAVMYAANSVDLDMPALMSRRGRGMLRAHGIPPLMGLMGTAGAAAPEAEAVAAEESTVRMDFPEMVCVESFALEGVAERTIKLGEQIGLWRCRAYLFSGIDYVEETHDVQTAQDAYVELDLPAFMSPGDEVFARARYHAPASGTLAVQTATGAIKKTVQGDGVLELRLKGPGEVVGTLTSSVGADVISRVVGLPGRQTVTVSRLAILNSGDTAEGALVVAYPNMGMVIKDTIESLIQYPFG